MTDEERRARKKLLNRQSYERKLARLAATAASPSPRLTANPSRASHVRDYQTGRAFGPQTEVFRKCLRLFSPRS